VSNPLDEAKLRIANHPIGRSISPIRDPYLAEAPDPTCSFLACFKEKREHETPAAFIFSFIFDSESLMAEKNDVRSRVITCV